MKLEDLDTVAAQRLARPMHPGLYVRACLDALEIGPTEAAARLGVTRATFSHVLAGRKPVSRDMAQRIAYTFDLDAYLLVRLQMEHDFARGSDDE